MVRYFSAGTFLHFFQQSFSTGSFQWLQDPKDRFSDISGMKKDPQPNRVEASIICRPLPPTGPCPPKGGKIHCTDRVIKNRRINQCGDTAVSGIMFSVMDSTEVPLGGGGRGGCFLRKRPPFSFFSAVCVWDFLLSLHCFNGSACGFVPLWGALRRMHPPLRLFQAGLSVDSFNLRHFTGGYIRLFSLSGVYSCVFIPPWAVWRWMPRSARQSESRRSSRRRCISGRRPGQNSRCRSGRRQ